MKTIKVSSEAMDTFTSWFPDCNGVVDVDDCIDALGGYEITSGEFYDLIHSLEDQGVEQFTPVCFPVEVEV